MKFFFLMGEEVSSQWSLYTRILHNAKKTFRCWVQKHVCINFLPNGPVKDISFGTGPPKGKLSNDTLKNKQQKFSIQVLTFRSLVWTRYSQTEKYTGKKINNMFYIAKKPTSLNFKKNLIYDCNDASQSMLLLGFFFFHF